MEYALGALAALAIAAFVATLLRDKVRGTSTDLVPADARQAVTSRTSVALLLDEETGQALTFLAPHTTTSLFEETQDDLSVSRRVVAASEFAGLGIDVASIMTVGTVYRMALNESAQKALEGGTAQLMQAADGSGQMSQLVSKASGRVVDGRAAYQQASMAKPAALTTLIQVASFALQQYHLHEINKALDALRQGLDQVAIKADWLIDDTLRRDHDQVVAIRKTLNQAERQLRTVGAVDPNAADLGGCVTELQRVFETALGRLRPLIEASDELVGGDEPSAGRYATALQAGVAGSVDQVTARYQGIIQTAALAGLELMRATELKQATASDHFHSFYSAEQDRLTTEVRTRLAEVLAKLDDLAHVHFRIGKRRRDFDSNRDALVLSRGLRALSERVSPTMDYLKMNAALPAPDALLDLRLRDDGKVEIASAPARRPPAIPGE